MGFSITADLQFLRIALAFRPPTGDDSDSDQEQELVLKSHVTDNVAFRRMTGTDFSVSWKIETYDDSDDEQEDDDSDEVYEQESDSSEGGSDVDEEEGDIGEGGSEVGE